MKKICIIIPCYNEEEVLPLFYNKINKLVNSLPQYKFELLFVNDGSNDNTLSIMQKLSKKDKRVKYISFSTNFGKEAAMLAGLDYSTGDYVAIMDADLQDPPQILKKMIKIIEKEKYDCVGTRRVTRKGEPIIRSLFAKIFYKIINKISKVKMIEGARDFRLMTRQMADSIIQMREYNRYSKGLWNIPGFKTKWLEYDNIKRVAGKTKWSFIDLCRYAIECITSFSTVPLTLPILLGILTFIIAIIVLILCIIKSFAFKYFVVFLILTTSSTQMILIGILGTYLSKAYKEIKHRPIYIIKETNVKKA